MSHASRRHAAAISSSYVGVGHSYRLLQEVAKLIWLGCIEYLESELTILFFYDATSDWCEWICCCLLGHGCAAAAADGCDAAAHPPSTTPCTSLRAGHSLPPDMLSSRLVVSEVTSPYRAPLVGHLASSAIKISRFILWSNQNFSSRITRRRKYILFNTFALHKY